MATLNVSFRAESLSRFAEFNLFLPDKTIPPFFADNPHYQRPVKTLILLHGFSGDKNDWYLYSPAAHFSMMYNLAVVMPTGGLNFFLDLPSTGKKYCTMLGEDLVGYLRDTFGIAQTPEDTLIGGVSMGGFGALHTALTYPDRFGGVIALSSALIVHQLKHMHPDADGNPMANYEYYTDTFGDLSTAESRDVNPEVLYQRLKAKGKKIPDIYMACGTEDMLLAENRAMRDFLTAEGAEFRYEEGPGIHDWSFWSPRAEEGIQYHLNKHRKDGHYE